MPEPSAPSLWSRSLTFRRIVVAAAFLAAAAFLQAGPHLDRTVALPLDDLNPHAVARTGQQLVLLHPQLPAGGPILSFEGTRDDLADLWLDSALLDSRAQHLFFPRTPAPPPGRISITTADRLVHTSYPDTCRTTITVTLPPGTPSPSSLHLFQTDANASAQRFRQLVLDTAGTPVDITYATASPPSGVHDLPGCQKLLTVDPATPVALPEIPVTLHVPSGHIDLRFNPVTSATSIFTGPGDTFERLSLAGGQLPVSELQVLSASGRPPLDVRAVQPGLLLTLLHRNSATQPLVTVSHLRLGAESLSVELGQDGEYVRAYARGSSLYNYNLLAPLQNNSLVSFVLGAFLAPVLIAWVRKTCFPSDPKDPPNPRKPDPK